MGATPCSANVLTDRLLRSWLRCRRRAWLDRYGDEEQRLWTAHRTLQLDDQQRNFVALLPRKPSRGLNACSQGAAGVVGLRLKGLDPAGQPLEAHPPLLQRVDGRSRWGDFAYRPVIARQGRRLTREHRLTLALVGRLLETLQAAPVAEGLAVAGAGRSLHLERVSLEGGLQRQLADALAKLAGDLLLSDPPPLVADRRKCKLCSWRGVCDAVASAEGHLSEVSGIGSRRRQMLQELGILGLQDLAAADPGDLGSRLERFGEQHGEVAHQLVAQARVQRDGRCERLDSSLALPELINAPGVLLYDIESDPDARDDFLHGFVWLGRRPDGSWDLQGAKYHPFLVLYEHGEASGWQRLQRMLKSYPDWPVMHYGETESLNLLRMAQRQGAEETELTALRLRLIDVHDRVRRYWRLPLNSYGLKSVASWLHFRWHQVGVDGAQALLWWRQWRGSGPRARGSSHSLRWIFEYNHDDCLATWAVAAWLLKQDQMLKQDESLKQDG